MKSGGQKRKTPGFTYPCCLRKQSEALAIRPDGVYPDATAGGGGHSYEIASRIRTGRLIALDQDPDAVAAATERLKGLPAEVVTANFTEMAGVLKERGISSVDGILMDIGVSSHQLTRPNGVFLI